MSTQSLAIFEKTFITYDWKIWKDIEINYDIASFKCNDVLNSIAKKCPKEVATNESYI